jgi:hypothetical protein
MRGVAAVSAVTVPALVGLNLAGTGKTWIRWITFGLSLVAALSVALLAMFRVGDRWFLYRDLQDTLLTTGWKYVTDSATDREAAWTGFVAGTEGAISRYNSSYETELITPARGENNTKGES